MFWTDTNKETYLQSLTKRLEARIIETGESEAQFSERMGSSKALFKNLRNGSFPTIDRLHTLLGELGDSLTLGTEQKSEAVQADFVTVPLMAAELAAGSGFVNGGDEIAEYLSFRKDWFKRIRVNPKHAVLAHVKGNSMAPTLADRDVILIDTANRVVPSDRHKHTRPPIVALMIGDEARVKRISKVDTGLVALLSDNPEFGPEFRSTTDPDRLRIIGRVVWWGHTVKEQMHGPLS